MSDTPRAWLTVWGTTDPHRVTARISYSRRTARRHYGRATRRGHHPLQWPLTGDRQADIQTILNTLHTKDAP